MKPKRRSLPLVTQSFTTPFFVRHFFYLSLSHAPIFYRLMRMLWMQRNKCIDAATFKMIPKSSAHFACVLSAVKPKQNNPASCKPTSYPAPSMPAPLNHPEILLMTERHRCPHIGHKCEWPSQSNLLLVKCVEKTEDMKTVKTAYIKHYRLAGIGF